MLARYDRPDMLRDAGRWIILHNGIEVIFPNRILIMISIGRPVACLVLEINDRDAPLLNSPGNICDDLLNE